jgi:CheY-like chemotaxis protein
MPKGQRLRPEEREYIRQNCMTQTDEQMAKHLKKDVRTIKSARKKLGILKKSGGRIQSVDLNRDGSDPNSIELQASAKLTEKQREEFYRTQFTNSLYYKNLKEQLTPDEINFYLDEWGTLCLQFEDIVATEKRQIDELIKVTILGNRIMRNIKISEQNIEEAIEELEAYRKSVPDIENDEEAQERDSVRLLMIRSMQGQTNAMTNDYQKNIDMKNKLLGELNARRKDRVEQLVKRNTTFTGLVQAMRDRDMREHQGRHMELIRLAKEKKKSEFRKPQRFPDDSRDCILMDEYSEPPQPDIDFLTQLSSELVNEFHNQKDKRILVVDDMVQRRLEFFAWAFKGNTVDFATNAGKAIEHLKTGKYDLICLDYDLGLGQKGIEVADYIINNKFDLDGTKFLVHSMNNKGSRELVNRLEGHAKIVEVCGFEGLYKNFMGEINAKDSKSGRENERDPSDVNEG